MLPTNEPLVQQFRSRLWQRVSFDSATFVPVCVYHYTTAAGFDGIVRDRSIRATNFSFLNDPSEVTYGLTFARKLLEASKSSIAADKVALIDQILTFLDAAVAFEVYVACFSKHEDDLSQWRAYGTGQERYAIGFDTEALDALTPGPDAKFVRVLYEEPEQTERVRFFVERVLKFVDDENVPIHQWTVLAEAVAQFIADVLPELKDKAYENEGEWRIVLRRSATDDAPEVDASRGVLRPFLRVTFPSAPSPLPIADIRFMAPTRRDTAKKGASMLLRRACVTDVEPTHSNIPFAD
jgi:hypothetical protein